MSSPATPDLTSTRWTVVALILCAGIVCAMQVGKVPPALLDLRADLALGMVTAGLAGSIFNAMAATLGVVAGLVADGIGHRRIVLIGLACLAIGSLLGSLAQDGTWLLATRLVEGIGFVVIIVAAPGLIVRAARGRDQRLAFGMWGSFMPIGITLMMLASPVVLAAVDWRGLWVMNAAIAALFVVVLALGIRDGRQASTTGPAPRPTSWRGVLQVISRPGPWLLAGCFAAYSTQWSAVMTWLPTFLIETQGRSTAAAALLSALVVLVNAPGNLLGGVLLHRDVPRWLIVALATGGMGLLAMGIYAGAVPDTLKYGLALAFSFLGGMVPAVVIAGAPVHAPTPALVATTNGLSIQGANFGNLIGPPALAAFVAGMGGWERSGWLFLGVGLLGVILALGLRAVERRL